MLSKTEIDFSQIKNDFPILQQNNRNKPLVYLDTAVSAQKPKSVIHAIQQFYLNDYANIHRGIYELSERASKIYESTRKTIQTFINAKNADEIVFTHGTTDAINLIAAALSYSQKWKAGDEVIISEMEHHSNIVPWLLLKEKIGIVLKIIPVTDDGALDLTQYENLFSAKTKLLSICHASNVLGTVNPIKEMVKIAKKKNVTVLVDGAQAIAHLPVDVVDLDCDFYVFSAHKLYGPTGVGVMYGKSQLLNNMSPYQGGGGMIETVSFNEVTFVKGPQKFEAGTPNIAGVVGMGAAIHYIQSISMKKIVEHEEMLLNYAEEKLATIPGIHIFGKVKPKVGVISFVMSDAHAHDVGTVLDHEGIAVRAGHHCAMPLMQRFNVPAMMRISFGIYNTKEDIDQLIAGLLLVKRLFS